MDVVSSWFLQLTDHPIRSFLLCYLVALWTVALDQHSLRRIGYLMSFNEFRRPVSVDSAPRGSLCEWCGKPAIQQLTAIGGSYHNDSGLFCRPCGEKFAEAVMNALHTATAQTEAH